MSKKKRRTYKELFIAELKEQSAGEQTLVGNLTLCDALGWDRERYNRIKNELAEENAIVVGRGRGGSVGLAESAGKDALRFHFLFP